MKQATEDAAMTTLQVYATHSRKAGETTQDALIRTCSEQPGMYASYDAARRLAARANKAPHPLQAAEPPPEFRAEESQVALFRRRASEAGLSLKDWLVTTPEGRAAYIDYDYKFGGRL